MAVRKGKKNKFKFVWTKELIFLIVGILAMLAAVIVLDQPSASSKIYDEWQAYATTDDSGNVTSVISTEHNLSKISLNSLAKKVKNSSDYIYVFYGTPQDSTCVSYISIFDALADDYGIDKIYYLNADFVYDEEDKTDREFENSIDEKEAKLNSNIDFFHYPSLWVFKDGELVFNSETYFDEDTNALYTNFTWKTVGELWANTGYVPEN